MPSPPRGKLLLALALAHNWRFLSCLATHTRRHMRTRCYHHRKHYRFRRLPTKGGCSHRHIPSSLSQTRVLLTWLNSPPLHHRIRGVDLSAPWGAMDARKPYSDVCPPNRSMDVFFPSPKRHRHRRQNRFRLNHHTYAAVSCTRLDHHQTGSGFQGTQRSGAEQLRLHHDSAGLRATEERDRESDGKAEP